MFVPRKYTRHRYLFLRIYDPRHPLVFTQVTSQICHRWVRTVSSLGDKESGMKRNWRYLPENKKTNKQNRNVLYIMIDISFIKGLSLIQSVTNPEELLYVVVSHVSYVSHLRFLHQRLT